MSVLLTFNEVSGGYVRQRLEDLQPGTRFRFSLCERSGTLIRVGLSGAVVKYDDGRNETTVIAAGAEVELEDTLDDLL